MRPQLHFTADGWINDPHGFVVVDGRYHAFYQYVPASTDWEVGIHWGHAVGPDPTSLRSTGSAIAPGDGDDGVWTGSVIDADGVTAFYTSVAGVNTAMGRVRVATPVDDSLERWRKGSIVVEPPEGLGLTAFRDPFVFADDGCWRMLVGGAMADGVAGLLSFSSVDLEDWRFDGVAASRSTLAQDPVWTGELWECPQLITVDGYDVLVFSVWAGDAGYGTVSAVGHWHAGRFDVERWEALAHGPSYYAPTVHRDADGAPCITFWMRGVVDPDGTWAGVHSLPWVLSVVDGALRMSLHESAADRLRSVPVDGAVIDGPSLVRWDAATGERVEFAADNGSWELRAEPEEIALIVAGRRTAMPRGNDDVLVLIDGPVVEIAHAGSILGGAVPVTRTAATTR